MTLFKRLHESTIKNDKRLIKYDEHVFPLFDVKVNNNWMTSCMNHQRSSSISLRISAYQFSIMPIRSSRCHNIQSPDTQRPRTKDIYSYVNELLTVLIAVYSVMNRINHCVLCNRTADSQFLYTGTRLSLTLYFYCLCFVLFYSCLYHFDHSSKRLIDVALWFQRDIDPV